MNSDPEKIRALPGEAPPPSAELCGPSKAAVLTMLRHERQRRRHLRTGAALLAMIPVAVGALLWNHPPTLVVPIARAPASPPPGLIHRVNDDELLALLQGTPSALMPLPNGDRRLLVIEETAVPKH